MKVKSIHAALLAASFIGIGAAIAHGAPTTLAAGEGATSQTGSGAASTRTDATGGASAGKSQRQRDAQGERSTETAGSGKAVGRSPTMIYMLLPVEIADASPANRQGCWAKVYSRENFAGDTLTLVGPVALADMSKGPFGIDWDDRVNSIETGPKATVTVYDNDDFEDQVVQIRPGQRVANLDPRMGFFDDFASLRIDCRSA